MSQEIKPSETVAEAWGLKCPQCGDSDHLRIAGTAWMTLTVDGTDAHGDHEWDYSSPARCEKCGCAGVVVEFQIDETGLSVLENIAQDHLGFETLEQRGSDRLDFKDVSVWSVREALLAAYKAGQRDCK